MSNPPVINREQLIEALGSVVYTDSNNCACLGLRGDSDVTEEIDAAVVAINARIAAHVRGVLKVVKGPDDDSHLTYAEWVEKHHGKDLADRARELSAAVNLDILDRMFGASPPAAAVQPVGCQHQWRNLDGISQVTSNLICEKCGVQRLANTPAQQAQVAGDAEAWYADDHLTDKSATTYDPSIAARWIAKGWSVTPLYTAPKPAAVVLSDSDCDAIAMAVCKEVIDDDRANVGSKPGPRYHSAIRAAITGAKP